MAKTRHRYWGDQLDGMAHELSKLAIACDIKMFEPGMAERILKNDENVCGRSNPEAFKKLRRHLMALFPLEERAIERLGADETQEILDQVRAKIIALRDAGKPGQSDPLDD
ncbi:MAG: hypothetical protein ACR2QV_04305 [Gammaproteobacteria bacterium]